MKPLLFLAFFLGLTAGARAQEGVFIVHPAVTDTALSPVDLKDVLLGSITKWPGAGIAIKLVVLADGPLHTKLIKDFTQRTPDQFEKFWKKRVFTGTGVMPALARDEAELVAYVAANPGAIGYVSPASVTDKVKILPSK